MMNPASQFRRAGAARAAVTMQAVARAAGVSAMTVSRALRNDPSVAADTARRVRAEAARLGYRPNPLVCALMSQLHREGPAPTVVVAWVTAFRPGHDWRRYPGLVRFHDGAVARCRELGYRLDEFALRSAGQSDRRAGEILYNRGILGLVVAPLPTGEHRIDLGWERFSAVTIGYSLRDPDLTRVSNHQFDTVRGAYGRLRGLGYRRIGLALPASEDERVNHAWLGGFESCTRLLPASERVPALCAPRWSPAGLLRWLRAHRPDAVISTLADVQDWLEQGGVRVPGDVAFANLDLHREGRQAGMDQNGRLVGAAAIDILVAQMLHNERGVPEHPRVVMLRSTWVDGPTVARRPAR